jgi:hypothetical protein
MAHGQLHGLAKLGLWLHLIRCKSCKRRLEHFGAVSGLLRAAVLGLHPSSADFGMRQTPDEGWRLPSPRRVALLTTVVIVAGCMMYGIWDHTVSANAAAMSAAANVADHCR